MVDTEQGGKGTRTIATDWPNEDGLTAGTQKQTGREENLIPQESSIVLRRDRMLIDG